MQCAGLRSMLAETEQFVNREGIIIVHTGHAGLLCSNLGGHILGQKPERSRLVVLGPLDSSPFTLTRDNFFANRSS